MMTEIDPARLAELANTIRTLNEKCRFASAEEDRLSNAYASARQEASRLREAVDKTWGELREYIRGEETTE